MYLELQRQGFKHATQHAAAYISSVNGEGLGRGRGTGWNRQPSRVSLLEHGDRLISGVNVCDATRRVDDTVDNQNHAAEVCAEEAESEADLDVRH